MPETALYPILKHFSKPPDTGSRVRSAVAISWRLPMATRPLSVHREVKRSFNLELVLQAVERMRPADAVCGSPFPRPGAGATAIRACGGCAGCSGSG